MLKKQEKRYRRHKRIRAKIAGTSKRPRLCIFRSAKHIYLQLIDDEKGKTLVAASDRELKRQKTPKQSKLATRQAKTDTAKGVGMLLAKKALEKKIEKVVFDRGGYQYQGRVKAAAEGAREGGLKF
jgi:large subunit ribosomal protein L18